MNNKVVIFATLFGSSHEFEADNFKEALGLARGLPVGYNGRIKIYDKKGGTFLYDKTGDKISQIQNA